MNWTKSLSFTLVAGFISTLVVFDASAQARKPELDREEQQRRIKRIENKLKEVEPTIKEVQRAAMEARGLDRKTIDGYRTRASMKALAPKIGAEYKRDNLDSDIDRWDYSVFPDQRIGLEQIDGNVQNLTISGRWNLPKLVYNPEVLETISIEQQRVELLREITRQFYLRRRLKIGYLLDPPENPNRRMVLRTRIQAITQTLNALTDGVFDGRNIQLE